MIHSHCVTSDRCLAGWEHKDETTQPQSWPCGAIKHSHKPLQIATSANPWWGNLLSWQRAGKVFPRKEYNAMWPRQWLSDLCGHQNQREGWLKHTVVSLSPRVSKGRFGADLRMCMISTFAQDQGCWCCWPGYHTLETTKHGELSNECQGK